MGYDDFVIHGYAVQTFWMGIGPEKQMKVTSETNFQTNRQEDL